MSEIFSEKHVKEKTLDYFRGDELATDVWIRKYAMRNEFGELLEETPDDMHRRLAKEFARIENKYPNPLSEEEIYGYLKDFKYIVPQGSPMAGIGNDYLLQSLSNCVVISPPEDDMSSIVETAKKLANLYKYRAGVGTDLSVLRPEGMRVNNAAKTTSGAWSFADFYSYITRMVGQGSRRGALMLTMTCFAKNTFVLTEDGWKTIGDIVENQYSGKVWTHNGYEEIEAYQKFENQELYRIEAKNGRVIDVTAEHEFVVHNIKTDEEYLKKIVDVDPSYEELVFYD